MGLDGSEWISVVALVLNGILVPLLGVVYKGLLGQIQDLKKSSMTKELCDSKHVGLDQVARVVEHEARQVRLKLDKISNGGMLGLLDGRIRECEQRIAVMQNQIQE